MNMPQSTPTDAANQRLPLPAARRVVFVQYGDFRDASKRFASGGSETYFAQRYSVHEVEALAQELEAVTVVALDVEPYDEILPSGVRVIGVAGAAHEPAGVQSVIAHLNHLQPDHLILRTPSVELLDHALKQGWRVLPLLADSFPRTWRGWWRGRRLMRLLRSTKVAWVANHQRPASWDLARLGVPTGKIIPWDCPPPTTPKQWPVRSLGNAPHRLIYIGQMLEVKGLGDVIDAVGLLHQRGRRVELTVVGGEPGPWEAHAKRAGVLDSVHFAGRIAHEEVLKMLSEHDVAVVPSRSGYPEGLPWTIFDALCTRTPLILSDHPMFKTAVTHGESGLVFRGADPADLAEKVSGLLADAALYARLSEQSADAWEVLSVQVSFHELLRRWIRNSEEDQAWLAMHALSQRGGGDA